MAAAYSLNETTPADNQSVRRAAWRISRVLISAGWEVWGSSDGTTFSTSGVDHWTSVTPILTANGCWIALKRPGADQGHCMQFGAADQDFRFTYTCTSWSATSVNATTAPLAVGNTGYLIGSSSAYNPRGFCASFLSHEQASLQVINVAALDAAEDGSFDFWGWNSDGFGGTRTILQYSSLYPAPGVTDPYVFFHNAARESGSGDTIWSYFAYSGGNAFGGRFSAFGTAGTFTSFAAANFKAPDNGNLFPVDNGWESQRTYNHVSVFQTTAPFTQIGIAKNLRISDDTTAGRLSSDRTRHNYYFSGGVHGTHTMWDGTTANVVYNRSGGVLAPAPTEAVSQDFIFPVETPPPVPDTTPPTVSNQNPAPGATNLLYNTPVSFEVEDETGLAVVFVYVQFIGTDTVELVHDGTSFMPKYTNSTRTGTNPITYTVQRFGGWPRSPQFFAKPVDTSGNVG